MGVFDSAGSGAAAGATIGSVVPGIGTGIGAVVGGIAGLFGSLFGAHEQASAANDSADKAAAAAKYAADLQDAANKRAEVFTRQQSENDYQNQELTRKQNYGQYVAQRSRLGTLGAMLGLPAPDIPAYEASVDPNFTGGAATPPAASGGAPASTAGGNDAVTQAILDNYKALGVAPTGPGSGPTDIAYFVQQAKSSLASGERPLSYWLGPTGRIAQELSKANGGATAPTATAAPASTGTLGAMVQPYRVANPTPALNPYAQASY